VPSSVLNPLNNVILFEDISDLVMIGIKCSGGFFLSPNLSFILAPATLKNLKIMQEKFFFDFFLI
jgi:hypothetical protein